MTSITYVNTKWYWVCECEQYQVCKCACEYDGIRNLSDATSCRIFGLYYYIVITEGNVNAYGIRPPSDSTSSRSGSKYYSNRGRRQSRYSAVRVPHSGREYGVFLLIVLSVVSVSVIGGGYLLSFLWRHKGTSSLRHMLATHILYY